MKKLNIFLNVLIVMTNIALLALLIKKQEGKQ